MQNVDWDSLFENPRDAERDAVLRYLYAEAKSLKDNDNGVGAFALVSAARDIAMGLHLGVTQAEKVQQELET